MLNFTQALWSWKTVMVKKSHLLSFLCSWKHLTIQKYPSPQVVDKIQGCPNVYLWQSQTQILQRTFFLPHKWLAEQFCQYWSIGTKCLLTKLCLRFSPSLSSLNVGPPSDWVSTQLSLTTTPKNRSTSE